MRMTTTPDRRATLQGLAALVTMGGAAWPAFSNAPANGLLAHPFVFADRGSLTRLLECDDSSARASKRVLEQRCIAYLRDVAKFSQPFAGCNLTTYYRDLTNERRGAAEVLSTFATYAYLVEISQSAFGQKSVADEALKSARQILLSWARSGIREGTHFRSALDQFCDEKGSDSLGAKFAVGLTFGRGTPALVNAVDLLLAVSAFTEEEANEVDQFLAALASLIADSSNFRARRSNLDCNRYSNHVSIQIAALASIARLRHDRPGLAAIAFGQGGKVVISWMQQVAKAIYGPGQHILNCYKPDESPDFSQTGTPQSGEIVDRYRARPEQTFGYPMFSLVYLLLTLKILSRSDLRNATPIADARARIEAALDYYGPYFSNYLASDEARVPAGFRYPGSEQYADKLLSRKNGATIIGADDHLLPFLLARTMFPRNAEVEAVIKRAKQFPPYYPFSAVSSLYLSDICVAVL